MVAATDSLELFSPPARAWFSSSFAAPTPAQTGAWGAIATGKDVLVVAPTGSGKTLAAFLWSLDRLSQVRTATGKPSVRVLYVSPLKALAADIERNLRSPLAGIKNAAARLGVDIAPITVGTRTGDTPMDERRRFASKPPDILITTPESLFLLLTSAARESLRQVDTVIIDEVHAVVETKRGTHLALSLERLDALLDRPAQRIGLSATVRPLDEVAKFLAGCNNSRSGVEIVNPLFKKTFDLSVVVPVEDMSELGAQTHEVPIGRSAAGEPERKSIWPSIEEKMVELVRSHRSTIIFTNSRRLSERLCSRLNELAGEEIARAHHGSVSKDQRLVIEEQLKAGILPAVVATSSLELGIDMGAVDLVIQVEAPVSVASGLQRVGRAGHQVGQTSRGVIFPKWRGDLVECAAVVERMQQGAIEHLKYPRNPLDVLAQHIVAMVAMEDWDCADLGRLVRQAAPFETLPDSALTGVLDMLSGLYPSDDFAELKPRLNWDRDQGVLQGRSNAQHLAVTSGGAIPDRGLFGVFLAGADSTRVGELDEEMVYESRVTDVFALGASSWRIEDITHDRVLVTPAPGEAAKMPFWHGDSPGRPLELGRAIGRFIREISSSEEPTVRLREAGLDDLAIRNLLAYLAEQEQSTGCLPDDKTMVVERFRDELGDWRVCIHSSFGAKVHAPWALAIEARIAELTGIEIHTMHTDDGIVIRLPDAGEADELLSSTEWLIFDPEEIEAAVTAQTGGSALFASRFRECAARALLLPKRRPDRRTPLWQQRQKSANLLRVAAGYGSFPIVLETMRECLQDVFDLPGLKEVMQEIAARRIKVVPVSTDQASPFAGSLLFGYIGAFLYEGDAPLAEKRAQALSLDSALLSELLGNAELRELISAEALGEIELQLQRLDPLSALRSIDDVHDFLRAAGAMSSAELVDRGAQPAWLAALEEARRAMRIRVAGEERWAAVEDAARYRDALGTPLPVGVPDSFLIASEDPLGDLVGRFARSHCPFQAEEPARRFGLGVAVVKEALLRLESRGRAVRGEFKPGGSGVEWCDPEVLRRLRRRSLAKLRKEAEATPAGVLGRFLPDWQGLRGGLGGLSGLVRAIEQLQGATVPASALETLILPSRVAGYSPAMLDQLCSTGEVIWMGAEPIGKDDGWVGLYLSGEGELLMPPSRPIGEETPEQQQVLEALDLGGAMFFRQLLDRCRFARDAVLLEALWDLVWRGLVTNDTLAPLRSFVRGTRRSRSVSLPGRRRSALPARQGPPAGAGRWSLVAKPPKQDTRWMHATSQQVLDRYGVVTRGAVVTEGVPGGFAAVYAVLKAFEEKGACRRGYFVEGLGGAQFAAVGAVDRLREMAANPDQGAAALVLSASDPANPYGAALPWPASSADENAPGRGHRPGRKAGAVVVLVGGALVVYMERGARTLLTFTDDERALQSAVDALALAVREGAVGRIAVEKADGRNVADTPLGKAMQAAGFRATPKGLRLRA